MKIFIIALFLFVSPVHATDVYDQGEFQALILRLASNAWITKLPDNSAAFGWVRFIEKRTICTFSYSWCTQYWRHCLVGRITGIPDVIPQIMEVSNATVGDGTLRDVVMPDGQWFKTNGVNFDQAAKEWCMG